MPVDNMAEKECKRTDWWTPPEIMKPVHDYFCAIGFEGIDLDPATCDENPCKASMIYTPETDGLVQPWDVNVPRTSVWLNPPYGNLFKPFIHKTRKEACKGSVILAIYPFGSRSEQQYWQSDVMCEELRAICFVRKRVGFIMPTDYDAPPDEQKPPGQKFGNTYASGIYLYGASVTPDEVLEFAHRFTRLGCVREQGRRWAGPEE